MYFQGNMLDSSKSGSLGGSVMGFPGGATKLSAPWIASTTALATASAAEGYAYDVVHSGALPHDDVDSLVLADVTSLGKTGHLWTSQSQTNLSNAGYGTLAGGTPPLDTDGDGMSDAWEKANGLNPGNPADAITEYGCTGYTNLETYVNELADSL
jgi:Bacterial TSP3 repeat